MERGVIEYDRVTKVYPGATTPSVADLSLRIEAGDICALVGPSGSGKTTAMRMINRLIEPTQGEIRIDGTNNLSLPVEELRRSIGYVIQQVGLFPHQTVLYNVGTVPRLLGWDESRIEQRSRELLAMVGLDPSEFGDRYPAQLSGGQRQRVGVARALAADPPVMLMDEPFGAIDPLVREVIQDEFLRMQEEMGKTIIIVTHDLDEAMRMGDKVLVLREGGILGQYATPQELLTNPADEFIEQFVGGGAPLRLLALSHVRDLPPLALDEAAAHGLELYVDATGRPAHWGDGSTAASATATEHSSLRDVLGDMVGEQAHAMAIVDDEGHAVGVVTRSQVEGFLHRAEHAGGHEVPPPHPAEAAFDAAAHHGQQAAPQRPATGAERLEQLPWQPQAQPAPAATHAAPAAHAAPPAQAPAAHAPAPAPAAHAAPAPATPTSSIHVPRTLDPRHAQAPTPAPAAATGTEGMPRLNLPMPSLRPRGA